jgi:hypothetical protein
MLAPAAAHAGGYVALGVGGQPGLNGSADARFDRADGGSASRVAIGQRIAFFAIEGDWTSAAMDQHGTGERWDSTTLGVSGKLIAPIFFRLGLYGRLGLNRTWVSAEESNDQYVGNGHVMGAGLQVDLGIPRVITAALWAEAARHSLDLHDDASSRRMSPVDGSFDTLMVGLALGF